MTGNIPGASGAGLSAGWPIVDDDQLQAGLGAARVALERARARSWDRAIESAHAAFDHLNRAFGETDLSVSFGGRRSWILPTAARRAEVVRTLQRVVKNAQSANGYWLHAAMQDAADALEAALFEPSSDDDW